MTINLEQARKLHELGVTKFAEERYSRQANSDKFALNVDWSYCVIVEEYWAYDTEELVAMLEGSYRIAVCGDKSVRIGSDCYTETFEGTTITEALCNKLIYDIENGITTIDEVNK